MFIHDEPTKNLGSEGIAQKPLVKFPFEIFALSNWLDFLKKHLVMSHSLKFCSYKCHM